MGTVTKRIEFHFLPYSEKNQLQTVEKDEGGQKRRYLEGMSSGTKLDGHEERMTEDCIKSFMEQANAGDILLYSGKHGVDFADDIGILVNCQIEPNGDWRTRYRLYDESDGMDEATLGKVDKVWRQVAGLPPYTTPKQKGFSIEGDIPDGGIVSAVNDGQGNISHRVINSVILDGVVLVNRPAYQYSIASAIYKALGEVTPWSVKKNLSQSLQQKVDSEAGRDSYFRDYYQLQNAMDEETRKIMQLDPASRRASLDTLFGEYSGMMIALLERHPEVFAETPDSDMVPIYKSADDAQYGLLQKLSVELQRLKTLMENTTQGA